MKKIKVQRIILAMLLIAAAFVLGACDGSTGSTGATGAAGAAGATGAAGASGATGATGASGAAGGNVEIANFHGTAKLLSSGEFETAGKYFAKAEITSATADAAGVATVKFTVKKSDNTPVIGVSGVSFNINKLAPASGTESFNKWVPYIYRTETVGAGTFPKPGGTSVDQGYRETNGTLTDHNDGSYTYVFATNLASVKTPVGGAAVTYDRSLTHRVSVMIGGHSGATADAIKDFVPDGAAVTAKRDIVRTDACRQCHGTYDFHGHGGDRLTVENCVTCHTQGNTDAHSGNTLDMKVMIHKIHAGGELASIKAAIAPGKNIWQDTAAQAGAYAIYGYRESKHTWWKAEFPAIIENCTKCHTGAGANVDNWKNVPSKEACGSCHDTVNFATGANHGGGVQTNDTTCIVCHQASGPGITLSSSTIVPSTTNAHKWYEHDKSNIQEFTLDLTVSEPANKTHFVAGEKPVVKVVIKKGGVAVKSFEKDTVKDCTADATICSEGKDGDGKFDHIYLMVHGPRGMRNPALTTAARAKIVGTGGPYNLSAAGADLKLTLDGGQAILSTSSGGTTTSASITVAVAGGTFAAVAAATDAEVVTWLNANANFAKRAVAYLDEKTGFAAIRSRNLGNVFSMQLGAGAVATAVFGGDTAVKVPGGFYPSNELADSGVVGVIDSTDDPKVAWNTTTGEITYTLDAVDTHDLKKGTYVASLEIADIGRVSNTVYRTPSVAKKAFQVGTATEEKAPATNCGLCHQGPDGNGFVLDFGRHFKIFDNTAVDQCGACHDYQPQLATGVWSGARPISKRVHAVHRGSHLNYPLLTVDYSNGDPIAGRNWDIEFPQDIRNCETCHPDGTSSGSWKTKAARLPCSGCHDSDAAVAHFKLQTFDPTPENPYSGDEEESCRTCH